MNRVRELRKRSGMSQKELAFAVGVTRPTVSEWEHQKKSPSDERLMRLAEIFNVSTGVVLGYEEVPNIFPVIFVDDGTQSKAAENTKKLLEKEPDRKALLTLAMNASIDNVRRAIAILDALEKLES